MEARRSEVLPVEYFHVTVTLPDQVAQVALQNQRVVYNILFRAVARTLLLIAADPKHLGARIGFFCVLHTWGQLVQFHPHLHCVVAGGGVSPDGNRWIDCRRRFFLPVRVLRRLFRRIFLDELRIAFDQKKLEFYNGLKGLAHAPAFHALLRQLRTIEWGVDARSHFGNPERALDYLAHYTHKVAISNHRILTAENGRVTFTYKDRRDDDKQKVASLTAEEFIQRFLLHVLPDRFQRIRFYGFMSNRKRAESLALCRELLQARLPVNDQPPAGDQPESTAEEGRWKSLFQRLTGVDLDLCPACRKGRMVRVEVIQALVPRSRASRRRIRQDRSRYT